MSACVCSCHLSSCALCRGFSQCIETIETVGASGWHMQHVRALTLSRCLSVHPLLCTQLQHQGKFKFEWQPRSQRIYYGTAMASDGHVIDEVLCLAMLKPKSYTREDVIELHTHGGGVCAQRVLRAVIEAGARPARPGEFTLRAFLNGRLDLSQVCAGDV